jgi:hypothetical protein
MFNLTDDTCYNVALLTVLALVLLYVLRAYKSQENFAEKHHHAHHKHHEHGHHKHHAHTHHKHHAHHEAVPKVEAKPETPVPQPVLPSILLNNGLANIDNVKFSRGIHVDIANPDSVLVEKSFNQNGNDRYGVGAYSPGQMRLYTSDGYAPARINLSYAKGPNDFNDVVSVSRDGMHLNNNKLFFDAENANNSDPYYLQKIVAGGDQSSLRLTLNDNADESFQIWGNSCGESGGCGGAGALKHSFISNGDARHVGTTYTGKLQLGEKFLLSGVGDAEANDEWLRLKGPTGSQYYGGFAAGKMWTFGGQYNQSDRRIKTDIRELNSSEMLSKINKLKGYTYRLKLSEKNKRVYGLIAQEVQREFPELVEEGPNGLLSIDYSQMFGILVEAINELSKNL